MTPAIRGYVPGFGGYVPGSGGHVPVVRGFVPAIRGYVDHGFTGSVPGEYEKRRKGKKEKKN